jgi:hypothetical protein
LQVRPLVIQKEVIGIRIMRGEKMKTEYSQANADFTEYCHLIAQKQIYPKLLKAPPSRLQFESTLVDNATDKYTTDRNSILDGDLGIDRIVKVNKASLHKPLMLTVQERFRRAKWYSEKAPDVCMTKANPSGEPGELFKNCSQVFIYGWYSEEAGAFIDALALDVARVSLALIQGTLRYREIPNSKGQIMAVFDVGELEQIGAILWRQNTSEETGGSVV